MNTTETCISKDILRDHQAGENGMFVYESVPGTAAEHFRVDDTKVEFQVEGSQDAQVTLQLEEDCEYEVFVDGASIGG